MKILTLFTILLGSSLMLSGAPVAYGNGLPGQRLEQTVGDYIIDVGTDSVASPLSGQPITFDFAPLQKNTRAALSYTSVAVNIQKDNNVLLNGTLRAASDGPTYLTFTFPEEGTYLLSVSFFNGNKELVKGALPALVIKKGPQSSASTPETPPATHFWRTDPGSNVHLSEYFNNYTIDLATRQKTIPTAEVPVLFHAGLFDQSGKTAVPFTDVAVAFTQGFYIYFAGDFIKSPSGTADFSYIFPKNEVFQAEIEYYNGANALVDAAFSQVPVGDGVLSDTIASSSPKAGGSILLNSPSLKSLLRTVGIVLQYILIVVILFIIIRHAIKKN